MHDHIATDAKFCDRFQRETLLMARFHHPGAVTLYDASLTDANGGQRAPPPASGKPEPPPKRV